MEGRILQRKLREMGIKQKDVAEILGITAQSVSSIMNAASVKTSTLEKIAEGLGKDISIFFQQDNQVSIEELKEVIRQKDEEIDRLRKQIDRLLSLLEKMQG